MTASVFKAAAEAILAEAAQAGQKLSLELVELPGLAAEVLRQGGAGASQARRDVYATLRSQAY